MKTLFISVLCLLFSMGTSAQWKPAGDRIKTQWAEQINPDNVLPEYAMISGDMIKSTSFLIRLSFS